MDYDDESKDLYELELDNYPATTAHGCINSGVEDIVEDFKKELKTAVSQDPCKAIPGIYYNTRQVFKSKLAQTVSWKGGVYCVLLSMRGSDNV